MTDGQTLIALFEHACSSYTDRPAFTCLGKTLTYNELDKLSSAFAGFLQTHTGLQPGDRIAIQLPNLLQYPVAVYGALRAGLVVVNTNPLYTPREMQHQFSDSGAKALLTLSTQEDTARAIAEKTDIEILLITQVTDLHSPLPGPSDIANLQTPGEASSEKNALKRIAFRDALALAEGGVFSPATLSPDSLALLQYTGGTTGVAKGAMLTHKNLAANARQGIAQAPECFIAGREIYVSALPLYHIYAFTIQMLMLVFSGGHNLLITNPRDTDALVEAIRPYAFTGFPGINTLFAGLCRHPSFRQLDFSSLKSTSAGGMALNEQVAEQWKALTGIEITEGYGMTEASPIISSNPPGRIQTGTIGIPVTETEIKVIDLEGNPVADGAAGELCVRGPQVMRGYWQQPEATREVLSEDGWLRTGDIVIQQSDGYIRLIDRLKDIIVVSGFNVYPTEIEEVAARHAQVMECAAISVPDDQTGEAVKLYVVAASEPLNIDELRQYLRTQLTGYKVPKHIEVIAELPKSNVGKILRRQLRKSSV